MIVRSCPGCGRRARADAYGKCIFCNAQLPDDVLAAADATAGQADTRPTARTQVPAASQPAQPARPRRTISMPALTPQLAIGIIVVVLAALTAGVMLTREESTGAADPTRELIERAGNYPAPSAQDPKDLAAAYLDALRNRDGDELCRMLAPYLSGRLDLLGARSGRGACPNVVAAGKRKVSAAKVSAPGAYGQLTMVPYRARVAGKPVQGRIWLADLGSGLRVAQLGDAERAAGLPLARRSGDAPDVLEEQRRFEHDKAQTLGLHTIKTGGYRPLAKHSSCASDAVDDPRGDEREQTGSGQGQDSPQIDLVAMQAAVAGGDTLCVNVRTDAPVEDGIRLRLTYHAPGKRIRQQFWAHINDDGQARVTSGSDRAPWLVDATVGRNGNQVSVTLPRAAFPVNAPELDRFGLSAYTLYVHSPSSQMTDTLPDKGYVIFPERKLKRG